ncbi:NAD(+) synthase [Mesorhizobium sp. SP-1A]|uniref:NAD(+) synthase n=1 Tax=Mesorhizobium sp. SP-1A TaxID=3077840 RepID=UPI0028F71AD0|nr:NAD(+) synthase [Mesorhizobium sp. SP-1A]
MISINSSPYSIAKAAYRRKVFEDRVMESHIPLIYVNQVGGNDELVWDGASAALDGQGNYHEMEPWKEGVAIIELSKDKNGWHIVNPKAPMEQAFDIERYTAACIGLRDYVHKNGFKKVVLGLSGGADSALVGLMAADVFGVDNVDFITMPTRFTSDDSNDFAKLLGHGMGSGARVHTMPVQAMYDTFLTGFTEAFGSQKTNVAEENLQAQLRGDILSFFSNKFGSMILSTGNKSEIAMGYATLYGDMRGGFNPLKDLYKTEVFELLEFRHRIGSNALRGSETLTDIDAQEIFKGAFGHKLVALDKNAVEALRKTIDRPPSAELAEGQKDSDSLPDYAVLDKILWNMIDHKESLTDDQIATETSYPLDLVKTVRSRVRFMEYKRFQACPGPKIHRKAFIGLDWRHPMSSKFRA